MEIANFVARSVGWFASNDELHEVNLFKPLTKLQPDLSERECAGAGWNRDPA